MPVAERQTPYVASFDAFLRAPDAGPDWLREIRHAAFSRFLERGFPTTRDEEWRFTNVAPIADTPFDRPGDLNPPAETLAAASFGRTAVPEIVVVNGRMSPALSALGSLAAGVTVRNVRDDWQAFLSRIQPLIHTQQNRILVPTSFSPIGRD